MAANELLSSGTRPIRELICPDIEEPAHTGELIKERRRCFRYPRRLPGTMTIGDAEHQITCLDIGFGGIHVAAPGAIKIRPGETVSVGIDLGARNFEDEMSVASCQKTPGQTMVHLSMDRE
ncbi:MAG: PilZ domain-containing protein [Phycisphaerales bacterium]|nr:MAG: PilZ domain-containing protein [Phycisphaerales bacterium]